MTEPGAGELRRNRGLWRNSDNSQVGTGGSHLVRSRHTPGFIGADAGNRPGWVDSRRVRLRAEKRFRREGANTKIAVAAPEYGRVWGGIGTYVSQLLQGIDSHHELTILGSAARESLDPRITTVPLTNGGSVMMNYLKFQLALRRRLPELLRQYRPDLLVVHHAQMPDLLVSTNGCPVVVTTHTTIRGQSRGIQEALIRRSPLDASERTTLAALPALLPAEMRYWKRVRHALFVSDAVRSEVMSAYAPRLRTSATIANGLALEPRPSADPPPESRSILYTGRLLGWKGLAVLLQALRHLPQGDRLFVTGSGQIDTWRRYAKSLGLGSNRVQFLGVVPRAELLARLRHASLVVVPSYTESCPYSLIEAMALGRPIVASSVPGIRDMVDHGVSASLVPPGDARALADAMARILGDESIARRLGSAARLAAEERFSRTRMCEETLRYFETVLAAS